MSTNRPDAIIDMNNLTRQFTRYRKDGHRWRRRRETLTAVDGMSCRIDRGTAVGYIGANGAGKSTTIKMLTGILVPTAGTVRTCGLDPVRQRRELAGRIGVVFGQRSQLWWDLPLHESFSILAAIHRLEPDVARKRTHELVEQLEMADTLATPVRQLSLGQRMRAEVAAALLHSPELVILDEPTIGLDVLSKQRLREFLRAERADRGTTLLLTTHDMGDIERLCGRVLVVDHGRLVYDGSLAGLGRPSALSGSWWSTWPSRHRTSTTCPRPACWPVRATGCDNGWPSIRSRPRPHSYSPPSRTGPRYATCRSKNPRSKT
ncbi:ATP-binding cassette domain-containing protein [Nocardia sp. NPDC049190]|uniref:ABC transporter ATP-binding protein n=1 Tax=Nocardia sp. NPDC049190 TaxID=3155650 RepID=UPI0033E3D9B1